MSDSEFPCPDEDLKVITILADRILKLIPDHPEILHMTWSGDLQWVPGYKDHDLPPCMFRNVAALSMACSQWRAMLLTRMSQEITHPKS